MNAAYSLMLLEAVREWPRKLRHREQERKGDGGRGRRRRRRGEREDRKEERKKERERERGREREGNEISRHAPPQTSPWPPTTKKTKTIMIRL